MTQNNYLLIGLGGTGCAVVRELKKRLYTEWRTRGNSGPYPEVYRFEENFGEKIESRIATLSIDTNAKDLAGEGERTRKWRVFGETLKLRGKEKLVLNPAGIGDVLTNIERHPSIAPWVRDEMGFVKDITRGAAGPEGANQIRRMGRLALANGGNIESVKHAVADRLEQLSKNGQTGAEIHIACSLAAGTGSGTVIDVIAQIQKDLRNQPGNFRIYVHGFVTAKDVGHTNTGNFYANQYAALTELNAFRLANYQPWDITSIGEPHRLSVPSDVNDKNKDIAGTYKSVALITETTEGGANISLSNQIENVAEFIFQLSVRQMGNLPQELRYALTLEDRSQYPADENGGDRSTAFVGYGVQRVAIPEREIREKLVYSFSRQFVLKVLYNHWDEHYRDTPRSFSKDGFVDSHRGLWGMTREHLSYNLCEEVNKGRPAFDTYEIAWSKALTDSVDGIKTDGNDFNSRKAWLASFDKEAEEFWNKGFRDKGHGGGAIDYFRVKREAAEMSRRAREMRATAERDLLKGVERLDSDYVLHHLPDAIDFLIERIEADRVYFAQQSSEAVDLIKKADEQREEIRTEYLKVGRFTLGNKHERLFSTYRQSTFESYYGRTIQLASDYAQEFCLKLIEQLQSLYRDIDKFTTRLKNLEKSFQVEVDARITADKEDKTSDEVDYLVDANAVSEVITHRFVSDAAIQDLHSDKAMLGFQKLRGDRLEFAAYNDKMPIDEETQRVGGPLVDELQRICEQNADEAHEKLVQNDNTFKGIFGQNIVHKLFHDYGGRVDGDLETWLKELINRSMPMLSFSANERMAGNVATGPVLRRCVFVPQCKDVPPSFQQALQDTIQSITGEGGRCQEVETLVYSVPEDRNPGEIVVMSVGFFFSARIANVTHGLREKYLERLESYQSESGGIARAYFEVHTESHNPGLPDLMQQDRRVVLKTQFPLVLLANALGLMQIPEEDNEEILFGVKNHQGRVLDKIFSNMKVSVEIRENSAESEERFGEAVPLEMIALYELYLDKFNEGSLKALGKMVKDKIQEQKNIVEIESKLEGMIDQAFALSGKKESNATFMLFEEKAKEAKGLAKTLSDRSAL